MMDFFDRYSRFYTTSRTGVLPNRLNRRYAALIERNLDAIIGQVILDLGSHDGRWSFAALKNGAKNVVGIEGRYDLIVKATTNMRAYGIPPARYSFTAGDVLHVIPQLQPGLFDTIFCFGIFYHTSHHMQMINHIARLQPKVLLIDSNVALSEWAIIALRREDPGREANAISDLASVRRQVVVGWPSRRAIQLMLESVGFTWEYTDWHGLSGGDWRGLSDYRRNRRISLRADKRLAISNA